MATAGRPSLVSGVGASRLDEERIQQRRAMFRKPEPRMIESDTGFSVEQVAYSKLA